jgi:hypothetical protein
MTKSKAEMWEFTIRHFSAPRMNSYFRTMFGNREMAVQLYRWNSELASAYWEAIAYVEVALRNLIDEKMTLRQNSLGRDSHWIFDDFFELGRSKDSHEPPSQPFKEISDAMRRVRSNKKPMTPDQIISELSFGFWHQMLSKKQLFLWPGLASGFKNAPSRSQSYISNLTFEIRNLRNRIGHHHRLDSHSAIFNFELILQLARAIDEELAAWIVEGSRVDELLKSIPRITEN